MCSLCHLVLLWVIVHFHALGSPAPVTKDARRWLVVGRVWILRASGTRDTLFCP